jgi:hypothetical protein
MSIERMPDERLTHFYENIRRHVEADRAYKHQFMVGRDDQTTIKALTD